MGKIADRIINGHQRPVAPKPTQQDLERMRLVSADLEDLLKVGIAEQCAGFTRMRNEEGTDYVWTAEHDPSKLWTMAQLPRVAGTKFALCEFVDEWVRRVNDRPDNPEGCNLKWGITMAVHKDEHGNPLYRCIIIETTPKDTWPVAMVEHADPAMALASVMLRARQWDLYGHHKALFPHRYLEVQ